MMIDDIICAFNTIKYVMSGTADCNSGPDKYEQSATGFQWQSSGRGRWGGAFRAVNRAVDVKQKIIPHSLAAWSIAASIQTRQTKKLLCFF